MFLDWVPAHFPRDSWALARFDGTPLYEHADPQRGQHPDWGTLIFDFGRPEVRNFLVANAIYWLEEFHADGLRVDAVASMLYLDYSRKAGEWSPNSLGGRENLDAVSFLREVNATCYKRVPGIAMIAEESTAWPGVTRPVHLGGLGFGLKWNMGWMHDTLSYLSRDPVHRSYHHDEITFSMIYAYSENYVLPLSHDEVVHGKGSLLRKMAGRRVAPVRRAALAAGVHVGASGQAAAVHGLGVRPGRRVVRAGRAASGTCSSTRAHVGVQQLVKDLNAAYPSIRRSGSRTARPTGFEWIDANDSAGNVLSFLRYGADGSVLACVCNFSAMPHYDYRIGLPAAGRWTRGAEHRRRGLRRQRRRQLRPGRGRRRTLARPPGLGALSIPPLGVLWLAPSDPHRGDPAESAS